MIIDTHCHLYGDRYDSIENVINRAKELKVSKMINIGCELSDMQTVIETSKKYKNIYYALGEHPITAKDVTNKSYEMIEKNIKDEKMVAIGECGLDYHWKESTKEEQVVVFKKQIELAMKYNMPLIIHTRDAIEDTYNILSDYKGKVKGVIHCFSSSVEMANKFIELGFYISIGGPVTFKNAKVAKKVAKEIDINYLLVETDSPYLTPEPYRGKLNEPKNTFYVAKYISELREMQMEKFCEIIKTNTKKLFNI